MKYICDTNFILSYLLADNYDMLVKAEEVFNKAKTGEITVTIEQAVFYRSNYWFFLLFIKFQKVKFVIYKLSS